MAEAKKITIIGGGVGGYPAAIKAARMGAAVTLIERDQLGGTCLNRGCIPTKSLLHAGEVVETIRDAQTFGINCGDCTIDFKAVTRRKDAVVAQLRKGVEVLLKKKKIRTIKGTAEFVDAATVRIKESGEKVAHDKAIIATGSKPARLNFEGGDGPGVLDSDQVLLLKTLPKSVVIIGGGVIGVEFAQIFKRLGAGVTILEMLENIVPETDKEISRALETALSESGIAIHTGVRVSRIEHGKSVKKITFTAGKQPQTISAQKVVLAVGRRPVLSALGGDRIGLAQENGALVVNRRMETNVPNIYGAGDVVGGMMLAHKATAEGECAVANALGGEDRVNYKTIPACIYTNPEVASVGLTEEAAGEVHAVQVSRMPFQACGKALVMNQTYGMVKIISEKKFGEVLGAHIIGPHATDMIAEIVLGMGMEMTVEELAHAVHPHPTLSEAIMESARIHCGGAVHLP